MVFIKITLVTMIFVSYVALFICKLMTLTVFVMQGHFLLLLEAAESKFHVYIKLNTVLKVSASKKLDK